MADNIIARGMKIETSCSQCGLEGESANHVLFTCSLARQIWAMSGFPSPENGFHPDSIYVNVHYLLMMSKNIKIPTVIRRCFPWVLWYLWKNSWFLAQSMEQEIDQREEIRSKGRKKDWKLPPFPWLKCNSAVKWDKTTKVAGGAWVLRNHEGVVLLHSMFGAICSLEDAKLECMLWTLESMVSHRVNRVYFAAEYADLLNIIARPKAWPSYKAQFLELNQFLVRIVEWKVEIISRPKNRDAFLIAQSALWETSCQFYVACGHPSWLNDLFDSEKRLAFS